MSADRPIPKPDISDVDDLMLVARLRETAGNPAICKEAANTIERLTRERDQHQDFRLQNDREWKAKVDHQKDRAEAAETELAKAREALERIASPGTVAGMHEQDRAEKLQGIASAALATDTEVK